MLDEGHTRVYGTTKEMAADRKLSTQPQVPSDEIPAAIVQVLGYELPFQNYHAVDPLTAILSLTPEEQKRPPGRGSHSRDRGELLAMKGISVFRDYFQDFQDQYVLIGGAACDLIF